MDDETKGEFQALNRRLDTIDLHLSSPEVGLLARIQRVEHTTAEHVALVAAGKIVERYWRIALLLIVAVVSGPQAAKNLWVLMSAPPAAAAAAAAPTAKP